ncbi:MAG: energy-coupling factor transporter transmembrane protein EcfT [Candidatus Lokiarchaeota archaeon]|nr:energy-coupling factor transporter transmembrane protein EcfT [Candidatus Lokiarchaeota archaeon]
MSNKNKLLDNKQYIFAYITGTSLMHKLNPISKLIFLALLTVFTFLMRSLILLMGLSIIIILMMLLSQISFNMLLRKLKILFFILIISLILNLFFNAIPNEEEIILFYLFNLKFLPIRKLALYYGLRAFFILFTLYTSAILFTNTTSTKDFVYSLIRLKIPYKFCFAFMVGVKYIPTIEQEAKTIALAQKARGFSLDRIKTFRKAYAFISERLIGILVSILRKGHTTSLSMENRCFGIYKTRTNMIVIRFRARDFIFIFICLSLFILGTLYIFGVLPFPQPPSLYSIYLNLF